MTDRRSERIVSIDLLRAFAIFVVVAGHSRTGLLFPISPWIQWIWDQLSTHAVLGVYVFFVVSGFLITRLLDHSPNGLLHPSYRWFYSRRAGRILPLLLLVLFFGAMMYQLVDPQSHRSAYCFRGTDAPYDILF